MIATLKVVAIAAVSIFLVIPIAIWIRCSCGYSQLELAHRHA